MKTKAFVAAAPLAVALALASCGGGGGGDNSSSSSTSASVTAFCDKAQEFRQLQSTFGSLTNVSEAKSAFQQAAQKMQEVDDVAPPEVKSSVDKVLAIFKDISSAVQGASSTQDLQSKLQGISSEVNGLRSSLSGVKSFYKDNCQK